MARIKRERNLDTAAHRYKPIVRLIFWLTNIDILEYNARVLFVDKDSRVLIFCPSNAEDYE